MIEFQKIKNKWWENISKLIMGYLVYIKTEENRNIFEMIGSEKLRSKIIR